MITSSDSIVFDYGTFAFWAAYIAGVPAYMASGYGRDRRREPPLIRVVREARLDNFRLVHV